MSLAAKEQREKQRLTVVRYLYRGIILDRINKINTILQTDDLLSANPINPVNPVKKFPSYSLLCSLCVSL